ncbi:hypothetical protein Emag_000657 [Eimeria magna]
MRPPFVRPCIHGGFFSPLELGSGPSQRQAAGGGNMRAPRPAAWGAPECGIGCHLEGQGAPPLGNLMRSISSNGNSSNSSSNSSSSGTDKSSQNDTPTQALLHQETPNVSQPRPAEVLPIAAAAAAAAASAVSAAAAAATLSCLPHKLAILSSKPSRPAATRRCRPQTQQQQRQPQQQQQQLLLPQQQRSAVAAAPAEAAAAAARMALSGPAEAKAPAEVAGPPKETLEALQHEVARLRDEKRLAGEIFSETICSYEEEVRHLKEAVAAAQQQLKAAGAAAAAAAAARGSNSHDAARGVGGGPHTHPEGSEDKPAAAAAAAAAAESASAASAAGHDPFLKAAAAAAAAAGTGAGRGGGSPGGLLQSPSCRSLASSRSLSDRQTQHDDTDDAAEVGGSRLSTRRAWASRKETRSVTRLPSPSETAHLAPGGAPRGGGPGFFARKQTTDSLDGV